MTDMLIRDIPDEVIAGLDAHAGRLGLSRSEYVRRALAQDAARPGSAVSVQDLARFAETFADLADPVLWRLAEIVQDSMTQSLRIPSRGVKQAGFYVLGGAAMPAILIEIGFVTNPKEERKLREARYRDDIARAIASGLREYKRAWDQRLRQMQGRAR